MNTNHVEGKFKEIKGKVKEEFGHATNRTETEGKGVVEQVLGKAQQKFGDLKDAVKEKVDHLLESSDKKSH